jgi:ketosteroid isomerase-like protein
MSEANKNLVQGMLEAIWNGGDAEEAVRASRAAHCVSGGLGAETLRTEDEYLSFVQLAKTVIVDTTMEVHEIIAERDFVAVHMTLRGRARESGKPISVTGMGIVKVANGKIVEAWNSWDGLALQLQLGVSGAMSVEGVLRFAAR